jgi:hypothetical protein
VAEARAFCRAMQSRFRVSGGGYPTWLSLKEPQRVSPGVLGCGFVRDSESIVFVNEGRPPRAWKITPRDLGIVCRRRGPWDGHGYATTADLRWCIAFSGEEDRGRESILLSGISPSIECNQGPPEAASVLQLETAHHDQLGEVSLQHQDSSGRWWGRIHPRSEAASHPVLPLLEQPAPDFAEIRWYGLRLVAAWDESVAPWYLEDPQIVDGKEFGFSLDLRVFLEPSRPDVLL